MASIATSAVEARLTRLLHHVWRGIVNVALIVSLISIAPTSIVNYILRNWGGARVAGSPRALTPSIIVKRVLVAALPSVPTLATPPLTRAHLIRRCAVFLGVLLSIGIADLRSLGSSGRFERRLEGASTQVYAFGRRGARLWRFGVHCCILSFGILRGGGWRWVIKAAFLG